MPSKKYIVRQGFVVHLTLMGQDNRPVNRSYEGGEEITLEDEDAALHLHKLEFANQRDRDAAFAAEKKAQVQAQSGAGLTETVSALIAALQQSQGAATAPVDPQPQLPE